MKEKKLFNVAVTVTLIPLLKNTACDTERRKVKRESGRLGSYVFSNVGRGGANFINVVSFKAALRQGRAFS